MPVLPSARQINRYFLASWLIAVVLVASLQGARQFLVPAVAIVIQAFLMLPVMVLTASRKLCLFGRKKSDPMERNGSKAITFPSPENKFCFCTPND